MAGTAAKDTGRDRSLCGIWRAFEPDAAERFGGVCVTALLPVHAVLYVAVSGDVERKVNIRFSGPGKFFWKNLQKGLAKRERLCYNAHNFDRELLERTARRQLF